jgi:8-oxo-dGTP pyrophosphatase MutT (NUDIX family)
VFRSPGTGLPHDFFVLDGNDWVNVVPLTKGNAVVLIHQFRAGTRTVTLEIPGGSVETGESALAAAKRELREETGYVSRRWTRIGVVDPNPAIQTNRCTTYLAEGCTRAGDPAPDGSEELSVELHPASSIDTLVRSGRIRHALVLAAFHWFRLHRATR